jgi:amino acid adenylation domain-containing protein/thioester reductase-like protein
VAISEQVERWNNSTSSYPRDASLAELFARQAARAPEAPAVRHEKRTLTYGELDHLSETVASALEARGVQPGMAVGVLGTRSWEATIALTGILKAGGVCVPFDAHYPPACLGQMLADAGVFATIVLPGHAPVAEAGVSSAAWLLFADLLDPPAEGSAPARGLRSGGQSAYILFTSGTTGRPKPVAFSHRAVVRLASDDAPWCAGAGKRVLQTFGLSFDGSLFETWATLLNGGCLVVADRATMLNTTALKELLATENISHAFMTTSLFHHTARACPGAFDGLDMVLIGGEVLNARLARAVLEAGPPRHLINGYGPAEGGIMVSAHRVHDISPNATSVPIGRPVANSRCYVLRADGTLAGPGEVGELFIGGDGLALGYLGRPAETACAFVSRQICPGREMRLYRSGDRARWSDDGTLEFLGRADRQVKIRGFRVELEAIEAQLRSHPEVAEAAVHVRGNDGIGKGLSAYVTHADPARPADPAGIRAYLATRLPAHSIPALIIALRQFPLTANGKIDHAALRTLTPGTLTPARATSDNKGTRQPDNDLIARIWTSVLGTPVFPDTDFFTTGGNSLLATQVVTRTLTSLGLEHSHFGVTLQSLLTSPALSAYRTAVDHLRHDSPASQPGCGEHVDFEAQARLDLCVTPARGPAPRSRHVRHILLTGATGFVGAFLLERLLHHTDAVLHCPVRATDPQDAISRVHDNLHRYGLNPPDPGRINAYPADLALPKLGMVPNDLQMLADTLDLIIHNGARVNFLYPYQQLRDTNVGGTHAVIDLAMGRRIPLHYVSTVAVLAGSGVGGIDKASESTSLSHPQLISMGYAETKWVAERMLQHAAEAGLPVTVHRPYEITGHSQTGVWNTTSAICAFFDAITRLKAAPAVRLPLDLVPVDHVTEAIVSVATRIPQFGGVLHLTNPRPALLGDMVARMRVAGYDIEDVSYQAWVDALLDHVAKNPSAPITPFAPLFVARVNQADITIKEMYFDNVFPIVQRTRTDEVWPEWQATCPPVDDALLDHYIAYLRASGLLAAA